MFLYDAREFIWREGKVIEFDKATGLHRLQLERAPKKAAERDAALSQDETSDETEPFHSIGHSLDRQPKSDARLPDLLPASAMLQVDRREQVRQQRAHAAKRARIGGADVGKELRWVRITASDVALKSVIGKDTTAWPGVIEP